MTLVDEASNGRDAIRLFRSLGPGEFVELTTPEVVVFRHSCHTRGAKARGFVYTSYAKR